MIALLTGVVTAVVLATTLGTAPAAQAESPATALTPTAVDAYLHQAMAATGLPGLAVVVTHGDDIVDATGYGHDSAGDPITLHTPMRVASVSKSFTATAVMTLVDAGRISLDEPVVDVLPAFRPADRRAAAITVRELLNQTSGLSDTTVDVGATQSASSLADYVTTLRTATLAADPGTHYEYCNVNYDVAARLVEVVSGTSFGDYLAHHVLDPLGMSGSADSDQVVHPAEGYDSVFGVWMPRAEWPGFLDGSGAGGVVTDAADMGKWLISQTGHGRQVVSPASLRTMHTPSPVSDYGMGWGSEDGGDLLTHGGNLFTYTAVEGITPRTGYGFAVMTNSAALYDDTYDVLTGLVALSRGQTPDVPGGDRQLLELVLGLVALTAVGLGVLGVLRSRRWAARQGGRRGWRIGLNLLPVTLPVLVLALCPRLISVLMNGRAVTWGQLTYFAAPLTITVTVAALAGATTLVVRLLGLRLLGLRSVGSTK
jgi:CubicO group peptidase (beta-lactamase class C family)